MSEKQVARHAAVRRKGARGAWIIAVCSIGGCAAAGAWGPLHNGSAGILVYMSILGLLMAALPLGSYHGFRFADPAKVGACAVTQIGDAKVGTCLPASFRGVYVISMDGTRHSGFASA